MSTSRPRITITVTDQIHDTLGKLADIQGRSMSAIVLDYLELVQPINQKVLTAMVRARRLHDESKGAFIHDLTSAQDQAEAALLPLLGLLDSLGSPKPPTCNTGVTNLSSPVKPLKTPKIH
jgi:uncharacterized protein (DUF1778 family)